MNKVLTSLVFIDTHCDVAIILLKRAKYWITLNLDGVENCVDTLKLLLEMILWGACLQNQLLKY